MLKRYVTLAAVIGLLVLVPSVPARAARKHTSQCTLTTRFAPVEQDYGFPNVGTTAVGTGAFDQTCDGRETHGVEEGKTTITEFTGGVSHFRADWITYSDRGTLKMTETGSATPEFSVSGSLEVTGGTRLYRGATGGGTFTGSVAPNGVTTVDGTMTLSTSRGSTRSVPARAAPKRTYQCTITTKNTTIQED